MISTQQKRTKTYNRYTKDIGIKVYHYENHHMMKKDSMKGRQTVQSRNKLAKISHPHLPTITLSIN